MHCTGRKGVFVSFSPLLVLARPPVIRVLVIEGLHVVIGVIDIEQILVIREWGVMLFVVDDFATVILAGGVHPALHAAGSQIVARRQLREWFHIRRSHLRQVVRHLFFVCCVSNWNTITCANNWFKNHEYRAAMYLEKQLDNTVVGCRFGFLSANQRLSAGSRTFVLAGESQTGTDSGKSNVQVWSFIRNYLLISIKISSQFLIN